ncbi:SpoIIE family protein phosphatase OS=Streptomyces cyaneofuscatus OX=66883 GN=G3I52_03175 PE=4 SV=1 [Streptomyces cyaneofuscatus]
MFFTAIGGIERTRTGVPLGQLMRNWSSRAFSISGSAGTGEAYTGRDVRVMLGQGAHAAKDFDFTYEPRLDTGGTSWCAHDSGW